MILIQPRTKKTFLLNSHFSNDLGQCCAYTDVPDGCCGVRAYKACTMGIILGKCTSTMSTALVVENNMIQSVINFQGRTVNWISSILWIQPHVTRCREYYLHQYHQPWQKLKKWSKNGKRSVTFSYVLEFCLVGSLKFRPHNILSVKKPTTKSNLLSCQ